MLFPLPWVWYRWEQPPRKPYVNGGEKKKVSNLKFESELGGKICLSKTTILTFLSGKEILL